MFKQHKFRRGRRMRIQDKLGEIVGGELKVVTDDGVEFVLKPTMFHRRKIQFLQRKFVDNSYNEDDLKTQDDQILDILRKSYPEMKESEIESVFMNYSGELLLELLFAWKLRDRDAWNIIRDKQKRELEKLKSDDVSTKEE